MGEWLGATPPLLLAIALLGLPGLILARCLRLGWWDSFGLSAPLSLGVLALANVVSSQLHLRWGLPVIGGVGLLAAALCWISTAVARRRRRHRLEPVVEPETGWGRRGNIVAALVTLAAVVVGVIAVAQGIGAPDSLNLSYDGAFHMNAIHAMAQRHSGAPSVFGQMADPTSAGGFYPPTFDAVGALLVLSGKVTPVAAANLTALAIAAVWPLTMSIVVRKMARPEVFGYCVAMVGTFAVTLFPAMPFMWGTVWPTALSILCIGPAVVLVGTFLRLPGLTVRTDRGAGLGLVVTTVALAVIVLGTAYAQTGGLFFIFDLSIPLLVWALARRWAPTASNARARWMNYLAALTVGIGVFMLFTWVTWQVPMIESVGNFYWRPIVTLGEGVRDVLELSTRRNPSNYAFALLAIVGVTAAVRSARGRFLLTAWMIVALYSVLAAAVQSSTTRFLTGYWYNDSFRIYAVLPVLVLPLAALGTDRVRVWIAGAWQRAKLPGLRVVPVASALILCILVMLLQGGFGVDPVGSTVAKIYRYEPGSLITPGAAEMFERLGSQLPEGEAIAGSPWVGASLAGVLSGRPNVFETFKPETEDRRLVALRFNQYQRDPEVCAAVKRLRIGIVVTGLPYLPGRRQALRAKFDGFKGLGWVPGLTEIDQGGGARAFRVGPCRS